MVVSFYRLMIPAIDGHALTGCGIGAYLQHIVIKILMWWNNQVGGCPQKVVAGAIPLKSLLGNGNGLYQCLAAGSC